MRANNSATAYRAKDLRGSGILVSQGRQQGYAIAQFNLGVMYHKSGRRRAAARAAALSWYTARPPSRVMPTPSSSSLGSGVAELRRQVVPKDEDAAAGCREISGKAAEQGNAYGQLSIASRQRTTTAKA
jgi:hypothetical protein